MPGWSINSSRLRKFFSLYMPFCFLFFVLLAISDVAFSAIRRILSSIEASFSGLKGGISEPAASVGAEIAGGFLLNGLAYDLSGGTTIASEFAATVSATSSRSDCAAFAAARADASAANSCASACAAPPSINSLPPL